MTVAILAIATEIVGVEADVALGRRVMLRVKKDSDVQKWFA
ncbi:UNVERIFIED_ORG: hypothetical protein J2W19_001064 [Shinella zoogloeoides]|nr:hypothetical protein [Shinella zoogloeoides]